MMTKEEFRDGFREALEDMKDPNSEFQKILVEGRETADELRAYDPVLADKVMAIVASIDDLGAYIRSRGELEKNS